MSCVYICAPCAFLVPLEAREGIGYPRPGRRDSYKPVCRFWEMNPGPL